MEAVFKGHMLAKLRVCLSGHMLSTPYTSRPWQMRHKLSKDKSAYRAGSQDLPFRHGKRIQMQNKRTPTSKPADPLINNLWKPDRDSRQKRQNTRRQIPPVPLACWSFSVCEQACKHDPRHRRHQPETDFFKCRHHKNPFFRNMSSVSSIGAHATAPVKRTAFHSHRILRFTRKTAAVK